MFSLRSHTQVMYLLMIFLWIKCLSEIMQIRELEHYFHVVLCITLCKVILNFWVCG